MFGQNTLVLAANGAVLPALAATDIAVGRGAAGHVVVLARRSRVAGQLTDHAAIGEKRPLVTLCPTCNRFQTGLLMSYVGITNWCHSYDVWRIICHHMYGWWI